MKIIKVEDFLIEVHENYEEVYNADGSAVDTGRLSQAEINKLIEALQ